MHTVGVTVHVPLRCVDCRSGHARRWDDTSSDNAHEDRKGHELHELHAAPDPEAKIIEFSCLGEPYERFWDEISKSRFGPSDDTGDSYD